MRVRARRMKLRLIKTAISLRVRACCSSSPAPTSTSGRSPGSPSCRCSGVILDERTEKPASTASSAAWSPTAAASTGSSASCSASATCRSSPRSRSCSLLVAYQAITFALFAWIVRRLHDRLGCRRHLLAPVTYVAVELVVPYVFPWYLAITQAWVRAGHPDRRPDRPARRVVPARPRPTARSTSRGARWRADKRCPRRRLAIAVAVDRRRRSSTARCASTRSRPRAPPRPSSRSAWCRPTSASTRSGARSCAAEQLAVHQRARAIARATGAEPDRVARVVVPVLCSAATRRTTGRENDRARAQRGFTTPLLFGALTAGARAALSVQLGAHARRATATCAACSTRTSSWCSASTSPTTSR